VESTDGYLILQDWFIGAVTRPMYRAWLKMAVASGEITLPRGLDMESLYTAVYSGPVMPWIDPVKEANAWKAQIRGGAATESDWVRASGRHPDDVKGAARPKSMKTVNRGWCLIPILPMTKEAPVPMPKKRRINVRKPA
jgi:capsid protein